ncbi:Sec63, partial [Geranomyces variabilis]
HARQFSFESREPSPNAGNNHSPRSAYSETNSALPSLRPLPPRLGGCKYETAQVNSRRRIPYSVGNERLEKLDLRNVKSKLSESEEKQLAADMNEIYNKLLPTEKVEENRRKLVSKLETIFNTEWPGHDIKVHLFGSSGNLLCSDDSDVDICITTSWQVMEDVCMIADLLARPDKYRGVFSFPFFNAVQSQCFNLAFRADRNLVVSAPTGSGKTCIMELAIVRLMSQPGGENAKVIYMAPTKLAYTRCPDTYVYLPDQALAGNELTGDTDNVRVNDIQQSNIIVTTPEKWDSMTRRWRDYKNLMALLRLILIDECHILNEAERGATLEVVVSRMRTVNIALRNDRTKTPAGFGQDMRFVALSATAPNIADIAAWLKDAQGAPADVRVFGEEYRPVQLRKEVLSYHSNSSNYFQFDTILDSKLMEVIEKFSNSKPTLIFCCTRRSVTAAAERLARQCAELVHTSGTYGPTHPFVKTRNQSQRLRDMQAQLTDKKLKELVVHGVAFHNGGLSTGDRHLIETAFLSGHLSVICATSTLAVGVNLPAHLVIIKGTMQYNGTECTPYSEFDITQMLGRAGRPQFDDSGTAVIMTDMQNVRTYQDMVTGKQIIESKLHENLIEHLNSEVVLGAVQSTKSAFDWLRSSFLYVRMRKNPAHYKLKNCTNAAGKLSAEQRLESICLRDLELLKEHGIMTMSPESGNLKATDSITQEIGESMARYYIKFATAVTVLKMRPKAGLADALETLCRAEEFSEIRFRGDKTQLNTLNKDRSIRFPVSGKIGRIDQKINVLIQCHLASISLSDQKSHLALEATTIMMQAPRIARFMAEVCATKGDALSLYSAINL